MEGKGLNGGVAFRIGEDVNRKRVGFEAMRTTGIGGGGVGGFIGV